VKPASEKKTSLRIYTSRRMAASRTISALADAFRLADRRQRVMCGSAKLMIAPGCLGIDGDPTSRQITLQELDRDPAVYLLPECDTDEDVRHVLGELCAEIFIEQLAAWLTDASSWPTDRSFDVFCHWFDYRRHSC
jgi:hypothetical protein